MDIARRSIEKPLYTWLLVLFCLIGGALGFVSVGKLEDPVFTIKEAVVITPYPGATAQEVATEVSEPLESAIQKMGEIKIVTSRNQPGISVITVEIKDTYDGDQMPQIWDDLRNKVGDAQSELPTGARQSLVNDGFGDVFGIFYAIQTDGFSDGEKHEIANYLRREILTVSGVADVELRGLPQEAIFVSPPTENLVNLGIDPGVLVTAVANSDAVSPTGTVPNGTQNLTINRPEGDDSVSEIAGLSVGIAGEVLNLADIADVSRERIDKPTEILRHNGASVFTLGVAGLTSENIVTVGDRVEQKLDQLQGELPYGVQIFPIYEQHKVVAEANTGFLVNLALSVGTVIAVLALFMGVRAAIVVGTTLLLTVVSTFFFMFIFDIKMERISLGALIIAMGMLVDNAIVVAEGMQIAMRRGQTAKQAAQKVAAQTQIPLLGATIIGIMAFAGIGLSPDATGEFLFSLFAVIGISLLLSWLLAITVTPLLAHYLFKVGGLKDGQDPYGGLIFRGYGAVLKGALRVRWLVIAGLIGVTAACFMAFGSVKQQFFPPSNTPLFYLNYKLAQGTSIKDTSSDLKILENWLLERDDVASVTATIGQGATRFILTYSPESADTSYGQLIIRAKTFDDIPAVKKALDEYAADTLPWAEVKTQQIIYGPATGADVEARFIGKDADVLRILGEQAVAIFEANALLEGVHTDWRERELTVRPIYATERAQAAGITREDVAQTMLIATDGILAGQYREDDRLIPIYVRAPDAQRAQDGSLLNQVIYSSALQDFLPVVQAIEGFELQPRDTLIHRRDRQKTLTVQANAITGVTPPTAFAQVRSLIEDMDLPPGYEMEWGGEFESASEAQASLGRQMPLSFMTMLIITILLFGKLRQTAVIWLLVPMAVNGVALGLLFSGLPFSFTALLGLLSLSGMLIKNGIVLVEEIDTQKAEGLAQSEAIVKASISRVRPVVLAAGTTILGMVPLLTDAFFNSMAVTIMGGLAFATILTLLAAPVLYHTILRKERVAEKQSKA
ncbi:efflux RND transporter permease subunit [Parasulfitobacter algicola]|uniref:Efflux RND transporter permease subunit n=1 Tax=Parasulfitobacter algicola TaxID=2614809 RepID=A0ABX2IU32_9RHOB|nr:efflux RND transporter permease subunit [Sulfitobacter algicola]NSX54337.1 efflux RND transporter permease subunit [Sulfitobacter algicola]